jgi:hypothetical protein
MTIITSSQDIVATRPAPQARLNWARIGFLSLNAIVWAGVIAAARFVA